MRKNVLLAATLILVQIPLLAFVLMQERTWGGPDRDGAQGVAVAGDGSVYLTGETQSFGAGGGDAFLLKYDANGALQWQRTWGGEFFDAARDVAVASDGGLFISGETIFSANAAFLVKFAADGSVLWEREWGVVGKTGFPEDDSTLGNGVAPAPDGGAYVAGASFGAGADPNLVVVRFDAAGNFVWQRIGGPGFGSAEDVAVGSDGRVLVTGSVLTNGGDTGSNAFVWTLSAAGKGDDAAIWGAGDPFEGESGASIAERARWRHPRRRLRAAPPYAFTRGSRTRRPRRRSSPRSPGPLPRPLDARRPGRCRERAGRQ